MQVGRGQRLGDHEGSAFSEMTVEDLLEVWLPQLAGPGPAHAHAAAARSAQRALYSTRQGSWPGCNCRLLRLAGRACDPAGAQPACLLTRRVPARVPACAWAQVVRRLPPEASAVKAIGQGLYYFDSGALAALLKELNKSGHVRRAQEVRTLQLRQRCRSVPASARRLPALWLLGSCRRGRYPPTLLCPPPLPPAAPAPTRSSLTGCAAWTTPTTSTRCATP